MQENSYETTSKNTNVENENQYTNTQKNTGVGLLSLVNEVKNLLDSSYNKKIEELEFKLLEKDEEISKMALEISMLKAQNEEKELENFRMREEINASKIILEQLSMTLGKS